MSSSESDEEEKPRRTRHKADEDTLEYNYTWEDFGSDMDTDEEDHFIIRREEPKQKTAANSLKYLRQTRKVTLVKQYFHTHFCPTRS